MAYKILIHSSYPEEGLLVEGKLKPSKGLLNSWYWCIMRDVTQAKWFEVFNERIDIGERLSCFGGGVFFNTTEASYRPNEECWRMTILVYIERISLDTFELVGFPIDSPNPTIAEFNRGDQNIFSKRFYIGW